MTSYSQPEQGAINNILLEAFGPLGAIIEWQGVMPEVSVISCNVILVDINIGRYHDVGTNTFIHWP